ncbi:MAG: chloride channel protein [Armatimonadota bacterium]|jgi:CIC family chloride channel protein
MSVVNHDPEMNDNSSTENRTLGLLGLSLLAILTGIVAGFGAVAFRDLIALAHNLLFLGKFSFVYNSNVHTPPSPWGPFVILAPVVGAIFVAFLVKNFAPEAKGHGVPEVMDAIYYNRGIIKPVVAVIKSIASAISIGSGGSVGREGPIVQIGSTFGSNIGRWLKISTDQCLTMIACGAGAGIAATFNTPVGGVLFAVELMLHEVSARTIVPVVLACATATFIGRVYFGDHPVFTIMLRDIVFFHLDHFWELLTYIGLGLLIGLASLAFIKSLYGTEDFFENRIAGSYYRKHLLGMFIVGVIIYLLMINFGHYYVEGLGYATVQDIFSGVRFPVYLLLLLFVLKLAATSLTLGSGASGGVFSPSLFLGATLGAAYGTAIQWIFPSVTIDIGAFAVAGMAGAVGGATGAAMTAIVMLFEMTLDYNALLPATITVAVSYGLRKSLLSESIYTMKLTRRGRYIPEIFRKDLRFLKSAQDLMDSSMTLIRRDEPAEAIATRLSQDQEISLLIVVDNARVVGFVTRDELAAAQNVVIEEVIRRDFTFESHKSILIDVMANLHSTGAFVAFVVPQGADYRADNIKGFISKQTLADLYLDTEDFQ